MKLASIRMKKNKIQDAQRIGFFFDNDVRDSAKLRPVPSTFKQKALYHRDTGLF